MCHAPCFHSPQPCPKPLTSEPDLSFTTALPQTILPSDQLSPAPPQCRLHPFDFQPFLQGNITSPSGPHITRPSSPYITCPRSPKVPQTPAAKRWMSLPLPPAEDDHPGKRMRMRESFLEVHRRRPLLPPSTPPSRECRGLVKRNSIFGNSRFPHSVLKPLENSKSPFFKGVLNQANSLKLNALPKPFFNVTRMSQHILHYQSKPPVNVAGCCFRQSREVVQVLLRVPGGCLIHTHLHALVTTGQAGGARAPVLARKTH